MDGEYSHYIFNSQRYKNRTIILYDTPLIIPLRKSSSKLEDVIILNFTIFILTFFNLISSQGNEDSFAKLEPGLALGIFNAPVKSEYGDSRITILKIDPRAFFVDIYCESYYKSKHRTLREWAEEFNLIAATNAGMYAKDYITSVGYLKSGNHINNSHINSKYKCIFACRPVKNNIPTIQIIDLKNNDFNIWKNKYLSFSQSIRMISYKQINVWQPQEKKWSIACLAIDKSGNVLFIHCRSTYSVHNFINILLTLPLNIYNAMYLEGGAEAGLYFSAGGIEKELYGIYESSLIIGESNESALPTPNIIGIKKLNK